MSTFKSHNDCEKFTTISEAVRELRGQVIAAIQLGREVPAEHDLDEHGVVIKLETYSRVEGKEMPCGNSILFKVIDKKTGKPNPLFARSSYRGWHPLVIR